MRRFSIVVGAATVLALGSVAPPAAAAAQVFGVTSTQCTGPGSFTEAVELANQNPGVDEIRFTPGLVVDFSTCGRESSNFPYMAATASESVVINGIGATVRGNQTWISDSGNLNPPGVCPRSAGYPVTIVAEAPGLIAAGTFGADNTGIAVTVRNLQLDNLSAIVRAEKNSSLVVEDVAVSNIENVLGTNCDTPPIEADVGADVTIERSTFTGTHTPGSKTPLSGIPIGGVVAGAATGAGQLYVNDSKFSGNVSGTAIKWGGDVDIVSSWFQETGGVFLSDSATMNVTNTAFDMGGFNASDNANNRILATKGTINLEATTANFGYALCDSPNCAVPGLGLLAVGGASINLRTSALGAIDIANSGPLLTQVNGGTITSDALSWVQPTGQQDATAINAIVPQALTSTPGLPGGVPPDSWPAAVTPMLGTQAQPGVLINAVPDAAPGGTNMLQNPRTRAIITTDVFGNARWDQGNDARNIGAVQNVQSPHLALDTSQPWGSGEVKLSWNRPTDPTSGPVTGYVVIYSPAAGGAESRFIVPGADSLGVTIPGLSNGTAYQFQVAGVNQVGDGPRSNTVTATPFGVLETPTVSGSPASHRVQLAWSEPPTGGHPTPLTYSVTYRKVGESSWTNGPAGLSARTTLIDGLVNGTAYEFGVFAQSTDGTTSALGAAQLTPDAGGGQVFVPIDPTRTYDSRLAGPANSPDPVPGGGSRVIPANREIDINNGQVLRDDVVPAGASAVAYNITATGTTSTGWFAVTPGDATTFSNSTVNWSGPNITIANGIVTSVDGNRQLKAFNGGTGSSHVVVDILGYYVDPGSAGTVFHAVTPNRVYDSRTAGTGGTEDPIAPNGGSREVSVADGQAPVTPDLVPSNAVALAYNVTVPGTTTSGLLSVNPGDTATYLTSTVNWPQAGWIIANGNYVKLGPNRTIKIFNGGTSPSNVIIDVVGYFTSEIDATTGSYFFPITPARTYDSRWNPAPPQVDTGALAGGAERVISVADSRDYGNGTVVQQDLIPATATSYLYNTTVTGNTSTGYLELVPADVARGSTSDINWWGPAVMVANGLTTGLPSDDTRTLRVSSGASGSTEFVVDSYGYYQ